jgi:protein-L-isoaspartate(D-aspartate) O-methyltransferase
MTDEYTDRFAALRSELIAEVAGKGIKDRRVLAALARVPRHRFVPEESAEAAYRDIALPIRLGQTISQPYTVGYQTEWLEVEPGQRVLEVGTGSGYQAAVLAELGVDLYSIERHDPLYHAAYDLLRSLGYRVHLRLGDGADGWPEAAPFDRILVTAAGATVPNALLQQLAVSAAGGRPGGRLVMPVGGTDWQVMTRITRVGVDQFEQEERDSFRFVPLVEGRGRGRRRM